MAFKNSKGKGMAQDFNDMQAGMIHFRTKQLPEQAEKMLMENTDKAFDQEQYPGKNKWKGRSEKALKQKSDKKDNSLERTDRRGILIGAGDLRASIETDSSNGIVSIGTDKVYAQIHNEGLPGMAFGKHSFDMPQRQYMPMPGEEVPFQKELDDYVDGELDKLMQ